MGPYVGSSMGRGLWLIKDAFLLRKPYLRFRVASAALLPALALGSTLVTFDGFPYEVCCRPMGKIGQS